jgi:hypothetical protein
MRILQTFGLSIVIALIASSQVKADLYSGSSSDADSGQTKQDWFAVSEVGTHASAPAFAAAREVSTPSQRMSNYVFYSAFTLDEPYSADEIPPLEVPEELEPSVVIEPQVETEGDSFLSHWFPPSPGAGFDPSPGGGGTGFGDGGGGGGSDITPPVECPVPAPGALFLGAMGLTMVGWGRKLIPRR